MHQLLGLQAALDLASIAAPSVLLTLSIRGLPAAPANTLAEQV